MSQNIDCGLVAPQSKLLSRVERRRDSEVQHVHLLDWWRSFSERHFALCRVKVPRCSIVSYSDSRTTDLGRPYYHTCNWARGESHVMTRTCPRIMVSKFGFIFNTQTDRQAIWRDSSQRRTRKSWKSRYTERYLGSGGFALAHAQGQIKRGSFPISGIRRGTEAP